jgi:glycosyltransferase involved in cell wall biosynthesis
MTPDHDSAFRVALPMLTLVRGGMGGSETYARELCRHLVEYPQLQVRAAVASSAAGFSEGVPEFVAAGVTGGSSSLQRLRTQAQATVNRPLRRLLGISDLVHYPLSVPVPRAPRRTPVVQTLLDVQHHDLKELFTRAELAYRTLMYDRPARRADAVITISEFSRQRIIEHLGVAPSRVHVAHLGVDTSQFRVNEGDREDFALYPARGWPHKNHARLIEAMQLVRRERPGMRLVLTGGALEDLGNLPDWVDKRGLVSRAELLELYRRAACLVFPSRYEGFGLPPLEAMASGCPVAAADAGSLPEICGDAAVLFDPTDADAIATAVLEASSSGGRLLAAGLARCELFTWQACAEKHLEVYRSLARPTRG